MELDCEERQVAVVDCPGCHKAIKVPDHKLGRWISCPVCLMEFAALAEPTEAEEDLEPSAPPSEHPRQRRLPPARIVVPAALLLLVFLVGGIVYAVARQNSRRAAVQGSVATVSPSQMPPVDKRPSQEGGFDLFSLQQGQGTLDSITGIGSTIQSVIYWTTVLSILFLATSVGMLVWVARDSRNRGLESVASWITPILFFNVLAFLVYMLSRPKGKLVPCRHCNNRCLENAATCPHCRRAKPVRKPRRKFED